MDLIKEEIRVQKNILDVLENWIDLVEEDTNELE